MVKSDQDVIADFNKQINMTAEELDEWLKGDKSKNAGWSKDDGSGESIGHESIVEILEKNPNKDPDKYDEEDIEHMRRVVSYNKRHLAQESKLKDRPDYENSKSYISLMNWGHNPMRGMSSPSKKSKGEEKPKLPKKPTRTEKDTAKKEKPKNKREEGKNGEEQGSVKVEPEKGTKRKAPAKPVVEKDKVSKK